MFATLSMLVNSSGSPCTVPILEEGVYAQVWLPPSISKMSDHVLYLGAFASKFPDRLEALACALNPCNPGQSTRCSLFISTANSVDILWDCTMLANGLHVYRWSWNPWSVLVAVESGAHRSCRRLTAELFFVLECAMLVLLLGRLIEIICKGMHT